MWLVKMNMIGINRPFRYLDDKTIALWLYTLKKLFLMCWAIKLLLELNISSILLLLLTLTKDLFAEVKWYTMSGRKNIEIGAVNET